MSRCSRKRKCRLGFALRRGSTGKVAALYTCYSCDNTLEVPVSANLSPEAIALRARYRGWDADANYDNRTRCPMCKSIGHNKQDSSTVIDSRRTYAQ